MIKIYKMKLHEEIRIAGSGDCVVYVNRVPGGWIYTTYYNDMATSAFVPLNNEFMEEQ